MSDTIHLRLPTLAAGQAQKHVTHNEALVALDAIVQLGVEAAGLAAPPASPQEGARYLVGAAPTGVFSGKAQHIAQWLDGGWNYHVPVAGWLCHVRDIGRILCFDGLTWVDLGTRLGSLSGLTRVGIGTAMDASHALTLVGDSLRLAARPVAEGGTGDLRQYITKDSLTRTASLVFQTAGSGRAEIGLAGNDDLAFKVSANGATWSNALVVTAATGALATAALAPLADNTHSLGRASARWTSVFAVNGVIQTSDARDKQVQGTLPPAQAARLVDQVDPILFRWRQTDGQEKDGQEINGLKMSGRTEDASPTPQDVSAHAGFRAQDLRHAMDAVGLDFACWGLDDAADPASRQWLRPDQLIPVLWAALKETREQLAGLKKEKGDIQRPLVS